MILLAVLAAAIIAAVALATVLLLRRTTINVVIRKDPDMATIKDRLAALETENASLKARLDAHDETIANTTSLASDAATSAQVDALDTRVGAIEAEIGTDPVATTTSTTADTTVVNDFSAPAATVATDTPVAQPAA